MLKIVHTIQIYPCGVYTRNKFPERGLSSRGEVIPGEHPTGVTYLLSYTEKTQNTKVEKNYKQRFGINTRCRPC